MQQAIYQAITNGQALPQQSQAQFEDPSAFIRSLDVFNNSSLGISLTLNGMTLLIGAFRREILNVEPTKNVSVNYAGSATSPGFVHIIYSDESMVPGSFNLGASTQEGVIAVVSEAVIVPTSSSGWLDAHLLDVAISNAPSAVVPSGGAKPICTATKRVSLVHLTVHNFPVGPGADWQIIPIGPGGWKGSTILTYSVADYDSDFAYPLPLYDVQAANAIGSNVQIGLWADNTPAGSSPTTAYITAEFLLT